MFTNGIFGVETAFEEARFTAVAYPQWAEALARVEEVQVPLNTKPGPPSVSPSFPSHLHRNFRDTRP
jgi:hypothetical protein